MKLKYSLAGLVLVAASCNKEVVTTVPAKPAELAATTGEAFQVHKDMHKSLKYIDTDGAMVSLSEMSGGMNLFMDVLGGSENLIRSTNEGQMMPKNIHFVNLFKMTNLDQFKSIASSSKQEDGAWTNKSFINVNGSEEGLFSVLKGHGGQWSVYDFAPSGADYAEEYDLNIGNFDKLTMEMISLLDPQMKNGAQKAFTQFKNEMQGFDFLLKGLQPRVSVVYKLNREHAVKLPMGVDLVDANSVVRIEGLGQVFDMVADKIPAILKRKEKDGVVYYHSPQEIPVPGSEAAPMTPVMMVDRKNDVIWISSRESFLDECLSSNAKLKDDPEFKKLMTNLSDSGSMFGYTSQDLLEFVKEKVDGDAGQLALKMIKRDTENQGQRDVVDQIYSKGVQRFVNHLAGAEGGFASTVQLNDEGILVQSRSALPLAGPSNLTSVTTVAGVAAVASPIIIRQIAKSRATQAVSNAKDIHKGMVDFTFRGKGVLPGTSGDGKSANEHLREFFKAKCIVDEKPFYVKGVEWAFEGDGNVFNDNALEPGSNVYGYFPGLNITTEPANTPLLAVPLKMEYGRIVFDPEPFGGQAVILSVDGAATVYEIRDGALFSEYGDAPVINNGVYTYKAIGSGEIKQIKVALPER